MAPLLPEMCRDTSCCGETERHGVQSQHRGVSTSIPSELLRKCGFLVSFRAGKPPDLPRRHTVIHQLPVPFGFPARTDSSSRDQASSGAVSPRGSPIHRVSRIGNRFLGRSQDEPNQGRCFHHGSIEPRSARVGGGYPSANHSYHTSQFLLPTIRSRIAARLLGRSWVQILLDP
jgi:hypothetical protein